MRYTIQDFNKEFPDNDSCLQYLFNQRFNNTMYPSCVEGIKNTSTIEGF